VPRDFANSRLRASAKSSEPPARLPIGVRRNTYITNRFSGINAKTKQNLSLGVSDSPYLGLSDL
jgi:hypothetical protein